MADGPRRIDQTVERGPKADADAAQAILRRSVQCLVEKLAFLLAGTRVFTDLRLGCMVALLCLLLFVASLDDLVWFGKLRVLHTHTTLLR